MPIDKIDLQHFKKHQIFIETGTFNGTGVNAALAAGFSKIYSTEIDLGIFNKTRNKFKQFNNVFLSNENSPTFIANVLSNINESCLFWLDAHPIKGEGGCPILDELDAIKNHKVNAHTILIDDRRMFLKEFWNISETAIIEKLKIINANYSIRYLDGFVKNDIICASADEQR